MRAKFVLRIRILTFLAIVAAILLVTRLYFVQIVHGDDYREAALGQYVGSSSEMPERGDILFTKKDGTTPKAATVSGFMIEPISYTPSMSGFEKRAGSAMVL